MAETEYRRALDAALREYESLTRQRADLDARIARLAQTVGSLTRLCGLVPTVPWGLTDACRMALRAAGQPLTALEVRAQLQALGIDLSRYANDLAAIHTILRRLQERGEATFVGRAWDKPAYVWNSALGTGLGSTGAGSSSEGGPARRTTAARPRRSTSRRRRRASTS